MEKNTISTFNILVSEQDRKSYPSENIDSIRKANFDKIINILSKGRLQKEDLSNLLETLIDETGHIDNPIELSYHWSYILVKNAINISPEDIKEIFFNMLINEACSCPIIAISMLSDFSILEIPWIYDIPSIQDAFHLMDKRNNSK